MDVSRLSVLPAVLLLAMGLAACGNKADLFMPPPPEDDPVIEEDPGAGGRSAVEAVGVWVAQGVDAAMNKYNGAMQ